MPTPKAGYRLKDGTKVPGTTTIIGRFKDSGGLLQWAFEQGASGKSRLYEEAERAADIGTCAHAMVEKRIKGANDSELIDLVHEMLPDSEMMNKAWSAFHAYERWAANFKVTIVAQEIQLVSENFRYGGTPDGIGIIGNELVLLDWKTSNAVYSDHLIQLAAYRNLWEGNKPDQPIVGGFHLLRFAKTNGDFAHHYYPSLEDEWRQFLLFREAYDLDRIIRKRAA